MMMMLSYTTLFCQEHVYEPPRQLKADDKQGGSSAHYDCLLGPSSLYVLALRLSIFVRACNRTPTLARRCGCSACCCC
jgi:hypothetical protein